MRKNIFFPVACILMSAPLLTGCKDSLEDSNEDYSTVYTYNLVADASDVQAKSPVSRVLIEDAQHNLTSKWASSDKIMAYVLNDNLKANDYSQISNVSTGSLNRFDGDISSRSQITKNSEIAFFYPGSALTGNKKTAIPVTATASGQETYHDEANKTQELVELNLTRQDGTAETIGKHFDFQWAKKQPKSINGKKVTLDIGNMKRIVTIWGLRFTDNNNTPLANIDSVYISNVKGSDVFNLKTGAFVDNNPTDERTNIVLKPAQGKKLSSVGGNYTYAAFIPGSYTDVVVIAYVGNKCYYKEFSSIAFDEDKIYRSDLLKMEEAKQKPFVNVQGIKWATGNFIHYKEGSQEYWGIAPTQWWISRRAVSLGSNRRPVASGGTLQSSQFEDGPTQTDDDVDLFRFGDIENALNLRSDKFKSGKKDIVKKFFVGDGPFRPETSDRTKAKYGDLVWYHTMNNHKKYRYPTKAELQTLYNNANVEPAYCYTDKGTIVYGAYFTTNSQSGTNRVKAFPTGVRAYDRYKNVTGLIRVNKGLFLPITGRRILGNNHIGLRDMTWGSGAYGQYLQGEAGGLVQVEFFFFGPTQWNFNYSGKAQASAIRPVLDSDDGREDRAFAPFANVK